MAITQDYRALPRSEHYNHSPSNIARDLFYYPTHVSHALHHTVRPLHRTKFDGFLIFYVLEGEIVLEEEDGEVTIGKDQFLFLDCYRSTACFTRGNCEAISLHFDGQNTREIYDQIVGRVGRVFTMYDALPVTGKIIRIFDVFKNKQPIREALLSRWIYDLLMDIYIFSQAHGSYLGRSSVIEEVMAYINEHFKEDPSIEKLAELAALSPYHFIRVFKKETGMTPHEYTVNLKIRTVKYLLKNTTLPVKDICFEAGFSSESVLCSAFKRNTGYSPSAYRKEVDIV